MVKVCRPVFASVSARLPCYLSKGPLKEDFLDIYLTTFLGVRKIKKRKKNPKKQEVFFVSEIIASENLAKNCLC